MPSQTVAQRRARLGLPDPKPINKPYQEFKANPNTDAERAKYLQDPEEYLRRRWVSERATMEQIGFDLDLSRGRIQQLIKGFGIEYQSRIARRGRSAQIRELLEKSVSANEIVKALNVPLSTVNGVARRLGFSIEPYPPRGEPLDEEFLRKRYLEDGVSSTTIARELGVHQQKVWYYITKYKIPTRKIGQKTGHVTKEWLLREYIKKNRTVADLACKLKVSQQSVYALLRKFQIAVKHPR